MNRLWFVYFILIMVFCAKKPTVLPGEMFVYICDPYYEEQLRFSELTSYYSSNATLYVKDTKKFPESHAVAKRIYLVPGNGFVLDIKAEGLFDTDYGGKRIYGCAILMHTDTMIIGDTIDLSDPSICAFFYVASTAGLITSGVFSDLKGSIIFDQQNVDTLCGHIIFDGDTESFKVIDKDKKTLFLTSVTCEFKALPKPIKKSEVLRVLVADDQEINIE